MRQRDQVSAEIANFTKLRRTQRKKFALARKNLNYTQRAIARKESSPFAQGPQRPR